MVASLFQPLVVAISVYVAVGNALSAELRETCLIKLELTAHSGRSGWLAAPDACRGISQRQMILVDLLSLRLKSCHLSYCRASQIHV